MKRYTLLMLLLLVWGSIHTQAQDTIRIEIGSKAQILIYAKDSEALRQLTEVDINAIVQEVGKQIDETEKTIVYEYRQERKNLTLESVVLEKTEKDNDDSQNVSVKKYSNSMYINGRKYYYDTERQRYSRKSPGYGGVGLDVGLSNYMQGEEFILPESGLPYEASLWSSHYIALQFFTGTDLGGPNSPFQLETGVEISWSNYVMRYSYYPKRIDNGVEFRDYQEDFGESLRRNKFVTTHINIPLLFRIQTFDRRGHDFFAVAAGGYVGFLLGAHSRITHSVTEKDRSFDTVVNRVRYGLEGEVRFGELKLFARYDLTPLFNDTANAPILQPIAVGLRLR